jgi:hypothetical protein
VGRDRRINKAASTPPSSQISENQKLIPGAASAGRGACDLRVKQITVDATALCANTFGITAGSVG